MLAERIALYREGISQAKPVGKFINDRVGVFTMVHCEADRTSAQDTARESFVWYANISGQLVANFTMWLEELGTGLGSFNYGPYVMVKEMMEAAKNKAETDAEESGWVITLEDLDEKGAVLVGDPDRCIEVAKRYEAAGCEMLMCLVNPYKIPQDKVMESIELMDRPWCRTSSTSSGPRKRSAPPHGVCRLRPARPGSARRLRSTWPRAGGGSTAGTTRSPSPRRWASTGSSRPSLPVHDDPRRNLVVYDLADPAAADVRVPATPWTLRWVREGVLAGGAEERGVYRALGPTVTPGLSLTGSARGGCPGTFLPPVLQRFGPEVGAEVADEVAVAVPFDELPPPSRRGRASRTSDPL